uniref:Uncharacterized protein n=1 Tax=Panagrolaimus sp. PS1159 TaxID=55785 RepID=A0AC35ETD7_9BILA
MATKDKYGLLDKLHVKNNSSSDYESQFKNLNLNQKFKLGSIHSQNISNDKRPVFSEPPPDALQERKNCFVNKYEKDSSLKLFKHSSDVCDFEEGIQKRWKKYLASVSTNSKSALSLHISAYENSFESGNNLQNNLINSKKLFVGMDSLTDCFEIPRQQKDQSNEPEIMKYKPSQKLLNSSESVVKTTMNEKVIL